MDKLYNLWADTYSVLEAYYKDMKNEYDAKLSKSPFVKDDLALVLFNKGNKFSPKLFGPVVIKDIEENSPLALVTWLKSNVTCMIHQNLLISYTYRRGQEERFTAPARPANETTAKSVREYHERSKTYRENLQIPIKLDQDTYHGEQEQDDDIPLYQGTQYAPEVSILSQSDPKERVTRVRFVDEGETRMKDLSPEF